jgi:hypothetical protein
MEQIALDKQMTIEIANDSVSNNELPKLSPEDIMWEARRQKDRKLYTIARNYLGLGKHWLQRKSLPKSRQWGGGIK